MGQATLDLPDPLLSGEDTRPLSPEALASADDLLSQLAGDDIDRLLSEADAERRPPIAIPVPAATVDITPPVDLLSADLVPAVADAATSIADSAPAPVELSASTEAIIDSILAPAIEAKVQAIEARALEAAAETTADIAAESAVETAFETVADSDHEAVISPIAAMDENLLNDAAAHVAAIMEVPVAEPEAATDAERQALTQPLITLPLPEASVRTSILIRLLELINSPMDLVSDEVRDFCGKIALLTTFNAVAVFIYVMVFRHPHH